MKRRSMLAIGLGVYVLALIALAPATLIDAHLQTASDGRLRLAEARGTLWSGAGQIEIRDQDGRSQLAKHVAWRLRPFASLFARLAYEVTLDPGTRPFPLTIFWTRIELANADIRLPPAALAYAAPKLAALELTGEVNLQIPHLVIGRGIARGNASVRWRNAGSELSPVTPLGDYELRFAGEGAVVRANLLTLHGPLQLDGQGTWGSGRKSEFQASARMAPQFQQRLAPFLRLIAVERGDGSFALQLK